MYYIMRRSVCFTILTSIFIVISGCNNEPQRTSPVITGADEIAFSTCIQDSDCIRVNNDCCSSENCGVESAINKNFKEEWDKLVYDKCKNIDDCFLICTRVLGETRCVENKCKFVI